MSDPRAEPSATVFRGSLPATSLDDATDAFGHRDYASVVVKALLEAETPFTLGLYGPWGVGKTTIIREVGQQLSSKDCASGQLSAFPAADGTVPADLLNFLALTRTIGSEYLPAFLSLKQSQTELTLPRYADFRDALENGDAELLAAVTSEAKTEDLALYAQEVRRLLDQQLRAGYLQTARLVVETAAGDPTLRTKAPETVDAVIHRSLTASQPMKEEMSAASAQALLGGHNALSDDALTEVIALYLDLPQIKETSPDRLAPTLAAIGAVPAERLQPDSIVALRNSLSEPSLVEEFAAYASVVEAIPETVPDDAGEKAIALLTTAGLADLDAPSLRVLKVWCRGRSDQATVADQLLALATDALRGLGGIEADEDAGARLVSELTELLPFLKPTNAEDVRLLLDALKPHLTSTNERSRPLLLALAEQALALLGGTEEADAQQVLSEATASERTASIAYALSRGEALVEPLRSAILGDLAQIAVAGSEETALNATRAILAVDPDETKGALSTAAVAAVEQDRFARASELLDAQPSTLAEVRPKLAAAGLERVLAILETAGTPTPGAPSAALSFALTLSSDLSDDEKTQLEDGLVASLRTTNPLNLSEGEELLEQTRTEAGFKGRFQSVLQGIWDNAARGASAPPVEVLQLLLPFIQQLDNARRQAFAEHVGNWLVNGQRRMELLRVLQSRPEPFRPQDKAALVRELLTAENSFPADQHADRAEVLKTARSMRGDSANADESVAQRLHDLRGTGNDDDRAVLQILDPKEDERPA